MNAVLKRLNLWTLDRLSRDTGWLAVPRKKRLAWAALLVGEVTTVAALTAFVLPRGARGWAVTAVLFASFAAFAWQLAANPVRTLRMAPEVGLRVILVLAVPALLVGYVRAL
jgi:hypothetical protein